MRNYKTRVPGIDRSSEAKNPPTNGSSALQKGTKEYTNVAPTPGTGPAKFSFGGAGKLTGAGKAGKMSKMGMILNPAAAIAEKMGAGPDTMIGKILNPLSIFKK